MEYALSLLRFAVQWGIGFAVCALFDTMIFHHLNVITDSVIASVATVLVEWLESHRG